MKAFLLAAGVGSRLRPITDATPKCMLAIDGKPLLDIWFDSFAKAGVDEVLVNLHHLPDVVRDHVTTRTGPPAVHMVHEPELLGSAGTLLANREWVAGDEFFLACNADNLTDFDLRTLIDAHSAAGGVATLTLFHSPNPSSGGVVEIDDTGRVVGFTEKPSHPVSDLTNAGIYAFRPGVLDEIAAVSDWPGPPATASDRPGPPATVSDRPGPPATAAPRDIGYDLLPRLVGRARAVLIEGYFRDIGTPDAYRLARQEWPVRAGR